MGRYQHVMYVSKRNVRQVYSELFGDVDEITVEKGANVQGGIQAKLGQFLAKISSNFSSEVSHSEIRSINFDDDLRKAKRIANRLLSDDQIPYFTETDAEDVDSSRLYRFSCEVETRPRKGEIDDEKYIRISRQDGEIRFRGDTSTENWGTRSHIIQSVEAAKRGDTYPYQGLLWPLSLTEETEDYALFDVNFVLICGPERDLRDEWHDKRYS
jgi:hypothetical protein